MKKVFHLIFGLALLGMTPFTGQAQQVSLEVFDCNNLKVTTDQGRSNDNKSFSLEKMLAPNIWSQKQKIQTQKGTYDFTNLPKGTYRITWADPTVMTGAKGLALGAASGNAKSRMAISKQVLIDACADQLKKSTVAEFTSDQIHIYPNPATKFFRLDIVGNIAANSHLILYGGMGQEVKKMKINNRETVIDLTGFSSGVYFITLVDDQGQIQYNEKLVITH